MIAPIARTNLDEVACALAANPKRIAIDLETFDPDLHAKGPGARRDGYAVGVAVAIEDGPAWYLPVAHADGENLDRKKTMGLLRTWARTFTGEVVGANLLYDLEYLALEPTGAVSFNARPRFLDVQLAEPLLDENRTIYALEELSWQYLGHGKNTARIAELAMAEARDAIELKKATTNPQAFIWRLPGHEVAAYAVADVCDPLAILRAQEKELGAQNLNEVWDLETRLLPLLLAMRLNGVRVDAKRAERARRDLTTKKEAIVAELTRIAGREVRLMAPESLMPVLAAAGLTPPRTPKTNAPSITAVWLERAKHPYTDLIRRGRLIDKAISTFIDGHVLGSLIGDRVYPSIHQLKSDDGGTVSGRFSYSRPNLQQLTARDEELAPIIRGCFLPDEGDEWQRDDMSQMEYRLLTHYARGRGADEARAKYNADPKTSFHKLVAEMTGLDATHEPTYKKVKNTNFCKVYGGGARKVAETAGIPYDEAEEFVARYDRELPFVKETSKWVERVAQRRGFIRSLSGRRHRFPLWEPADWNLSKEWSKYDDREALIHALERNVEWLREKNAALPPVEREPLPRTGVRRAYCWRALNRLLQGGNADALKYAMVKQWEAGLCAVLGPLLVNVHDEEGWSVGKTKVEREAAAEATRLMRTSVELRVPVLIETSRGKTWGNCK